jgi:hypothetical protein
LDFPPYFSVGFSAYFSVGFFCIIILLYLSNFMLLLYFPCTSEEILVFCVVSFFLLVALGCASSYLIALKVLKGTHARDFIVCFSQFFGIIQ